MESRCKLLAAVNDLRAMPYVSMATQAGAKYWACRYCNCHGIHIGLLDVVVYVDAARIMHQWPPQRKTRRHAKLLRDWKRKFRGMPEAIAQLDIPIARRTQAFRMLAGKIAEDAKTVSGAAHKRALHAGGYHGIGQSLCVPLLILQFGST